MPEVTLLIDNQYIKAENASFSTTQFLIAYYNIIKDIKDPELDQINRDHMVKVLALSKQYNAKRRAEFDRILVNSGIDPKRLRNSSAEDH